MLFSRLCHTPDTVHNLASEVVALVVVQSFVDGDLIIKLCNTQCAYTFYLFQVSFLFFYIAHYLT